MKITKTILLLTCLGLLGACDAKAEAPIPAAHKALYTMTMTSTKSSSIVNVTGQMFYEFSDACDAWSTDQKFLLNYMYAEEPEAKSNSQYSSHEAKDGSSYQFAVRRLRNNELQEEYEGSATHKSNEPGKALYTQPEKKTYDLPKDLFFPTQHTLMLISEALKGTHVVNAQMFDGSDGEGALEVNAIIGEAFTPTKDPDLKSPLLDSPAHKIRMAFYPPETVDNTSQQQEPDYEMSLVLHENGVVSSMEINYDQFTIKGELKAIEAGKPPKC